MVRMLRFVLTCGFALVGSLGASLVGCGGSADKPAESPQSRAAGSPEGAERSETRTEKDAAAVAETPRPAPLPEGAQPWPFGPPQTAEDRAAQLDRLKKDPGPIKSNWVPPGKSDRYGHAEGIVQAPLDAVRAKLQDFAKYKDLAGPKFKTVRVVDKQGNATDVYFQLPIMKGLITINYVTRFPPARPAQGGGGDVVEGSFVKGNIKGMHIAFTVRPGPDERSSIMICDLLLQPNVPAPQAAVDEELRDACGDAINAVRKTTAQAP